jgi:hypothetical protein
VKKKTNLFTIISLWKNDVLRHFTIVPALRFEFYVHDIESKEDCNTDNTKVKPSFTAMTANHPNTGAEPSRNWVTFLSVPIDVVYIKYASENGRCSIFLRHNESTASVALTTRARRSGTIILPHRRGTFTLLVSRPIYALRHNCGFVVTSIPRNENMASTKQDKRCVFQLDYALRLNVFSATVHPSPDTMFGLHAYRNTGKFCIGLLQQESPGFFWLMEN